VYRGLATNPVAVAAAAVVAWRRAVRDGPEPEPDSASNVVVGMAGTAADGRSVFVQACVLVWEGRTAHCQPSQMFGWQSGHLDTV